MKHLISVISSVVLVIFSLSLNKAFAEDLPPTPAIQSVTEIPATVQKPEQIDCKGIIEKLTPWVATEGVFTNLNQLGTPAGFSSMLKNYKRDMPYQVEKLDYSTEEWNIFGQAAYDDNGNFIDAIMFAAPKEDYSACGWNKSTVFSVVKK